MIMKKVLLITFFSSILFACNEKISEVTYKDKKASKVETAIEEKDVVKEKLLSIVFDVTSSNVKTHQSAMRHVSAMAESFPDSKFEVVVYSGSLNMVLSDKSTVVDAILKFADNENVSFKLCATTMKRGGADKSMLIKGVDVVPNPLVQIYRRQKEGWGYIKETNN
jgi:uncharacterized protein